MEHRIICKGEVLRKVGKCRKAKIISILARHMISATNNSEFGGFNDTC